MIGQRVQPKVREIVKAKCFSCHEIVDLIYRELLRSVNKHIDIGLEGYHCKQCLNKTELFRDMHKNNSIKSIDKITKGASNRSKKLWELEDYRNKMNANHQRLSEDNQFAQKVSSALKVKFQDPVYLSKVTEARKKYWHSTEYRSSRSWSKEQFIKAAQKEHGDRYIYDNILYQNIKTKIDLQCRKHGVFSQRPSHHIFYGNGCPKCALEAESSKPQLMIYEWVKSLGFDVILNDRSWLDGLELDILIPSHKMAIEYHGGYWHSYNRNELPHERMRHFNKCDAALEKGIKLFQVFDVEWAYQEQLVKSMMLHRLGMSTKIHARKCIAKQIDKQDYYTFCDQNHLSKRKLCDICYGLQYNGQLISVISFTDKGGLFEIERFCTKMGHAVVGGLSKLLKIADIPNLMTYADRRYSNATGYLNAGFKLDGITKPGYYYWRNGRIYNRRNFQKHKLHKKLAIFDPDLTEAQNMFNNGYRRIWDAGHYRLYK